VTDHIKNRDIHLVINTPSGKEGAGGSTVIRQTALRYDIPYATTLAGACAIASGIDAMNKKGLSVKALQDFHGDIAKWSSGTSGEKPKENKNSNSPLTKEGETSHGAFSGT
jgi:hypothetical protein